MIRQKMLVYGVGAMLLGCDNPQSVTADNNKSHTIKESNVSNSNTTKLSKELVDLVIEKSYIYTVNNKKYGIETLPSLYTKVSGKKRKLFLKNYLNYTLTLESLTKEQQKYQKQIDKYISQKLNQNKYRGIVLDELEKEILIKSITLRTIAREDMAKDRADLDKKVKEFYSKNKKEYSYKRNIEVSYIYFKNEKKAKEVLANLTKEKVDIARFASFAREYSIGKKMRFNSGYFGYLLEDEKHKEFFDELWKSKDGFVNKLIKSDNFFILVYIHQKREAGFESLEDVKDEIRTAILTKRVNLWINRKYNKIMKKNKVEIFDNFEDNKSF